jgi:hypothetical protein
VLRGIRWQPLRSGFWHEVHVPGLWLSVPKPKLFLNPNASFSSASFPCRLAILLCPSRQAQCPSLSTGAWAMASGGGIEASGCKAPGHGGLCQQAATFSGTSNISLQRHGAPFVRVKYHSAPSYSKIYEALHQRRVCRFSFRSDSVRKFSFSRNVNKSS